jgi:cytohesin
MSVARVLLAHGADIAAADRLGLTALHMVAQTGNVAMARLLLDQGANPNAAVGRSLVLPVFEGDTPLSLATICSRRDLVELLLQRGADPNVRLRDSFAALHLAESADIATLLIAHGASTTARGYEDRTPLHQAAMQGRLDVATVLLAHGSDIESKDEQGRTPLHLAVDQPASSPEIVALLLRHGANANARSSQQETALQAALTRDRKIVQILLDAGADVNSQDRWQRTSLHRAVQAGDPALVALLLSHGANVNARDSTNRTPLYYTWGGSAADREIARVLRRSGATAGTP